MAQRLGFPFGMSFHTAAVPAVSVEQKMQSEWTILHEHEEEEEELYAGGYCR